MTRTTLAACAALLSLSAAAGAQALDFDDLAWTPVGSPSGPSTVTADLMHVEGPDAGCTDTTAAFVTTAPFDGTVRVQLNYVTFDLCHYDWPLYVVNGVETKIYDDPSETDCWFAWTRDVEFEVAAGDVFGLGVGSADCFKGPLHADFRSFSLLPHDPWTDLGKVLDPRLVGRGIGAAGNLEFARALVSVGDVDDDGLGDVAAATQQPAAVSLHAGGGGATLWSVTVPTIGSTAQYSLAGPGDLDGDGTPDVVVGSHLASTVVALSGVDGATLWTWTGPPLAESGKAVAAHADVDGDGVTDIAVGRETSAAALPVLSGATGLEIASYPAQPGDSAQGLALGAAGDLTGDGVGELVVRYRVGVEYLARVVSGADGAVLFELVPPFATIADNTFGEVLGATGDLTGDGLPELYVGAPSALFGDKQDAGQVLLYSGADGSLVRTVDGLRRDARFGAAVAGGHDVDGDGTADLVVGQPAFGSPGLEPRGRVLVLSGVDDAVLQTFEGRDDDVLGAAVALLPGSELRLAIGSPRPGPGSTLTLYDDLVHPAGETPRTVGFGALVPGETLRLALEGGLPGNLAYLIAGFDAAYAPFLGGVLVPTPDVIRLFPLDATGARQLELPWTDPVAPPAPLRLQWWMPDPDGPVGFSASNGVATP